MQRESERERESEGTKEGRREQESSAGNTVEGGERDIKAETVCVLCCVVKAK